MPKSSKIREQLEDTLEILSPLAKTKVPIRGWIRSIRESLGMSGRQLAKRIHVAPPRIPEMEKAETHGNITLKSLRRAAEAMECEFVYAFVPKKNLEASIREQAVRVARKNLGPVAHTMGLENQAVSAKDELKQINRMVEEWVRNPPRWLWDEK